MRRLLLLVSAIVLVDTLFFAALTPLLPQYAREFGLSKADAGFLTAVYAAGGLAGAIPSGLLAARLGVRPTVLLGLAVMVATSVAFGLASSIWVLDAARFGQGVGSAISWTGALAWLVAGTPRERRGELIGAAMGAAVAGALLGPVLGGAASLVGTGRAFGAVAVIGVLLAGWAATTPAFPPGERQSLSALVGAMREQQVAAGFWLVSLAALLLGVISVLGPLRLDEFGWGAVAISGAFLTSAAVEAVLNPLLGRWSDRRGRLAPVRAGLFASIGASIAIPLVDEKWPLLALVVAAGIAYGVFWVPGTALLSDGADVAGLDQSFGFALLNIAWAPANVIGAAFAGVLAASAGDGAVYLVVALLCFLTVFALRLGPLDARPEKAEGSACR